MALLLFLAALLGGVVARLVPFEPVDGSANSKSRLASAPEMTISLLVKRTAPAVVNIAVLQPSPAEQNPLLRDPFFRYFFDIPNQPRRRETSSLGSGVIVDARRGYILTNNHVIDSFSAATWAFQSRCWARPFPPARE
ncbi:MAG: S1C family serine protease [Sphingomonas sp.]|nr:S1C family serine protease [Sphingomonas sp.]